MKIILEKMKEPNGNHYIRFVCDFLGKFNQFLFLKKLAFEVMEIFRKKIKHQKRNYL